MSANPGDDTRSRRELLQEIERLRARLDEAEQTLDAIRSGEVDALVVAGPQGDQVFSLTGAERTYRLIVETMNEAAMTVGLDGTILFCNQRFCDLVRAPMATTIGQKLTSFVSPAQLDPLRMLLADARTGPLQRHLALRAIDGGTVSVLFAASLLEADAQTSICLVASDLTELEAQAQSIRLLRQQQQALEESRAEQQAANSELDDSRRNAVSLLEDALDARRHAEEAAAALRESEERLRTISDQIPGGALYQHVQGPDGSLYYAYMSAGIEKLFGMSAEEIMADPGPFLRLMVEEDRPQVAAATAQSARELSPFACEFRQRTVSGEVKWVQCRSMPRPLPDGSILWDGIVVDVTEHKEAQEALNSLMREQSIILDNMPVGISKIVDRKHIWINRRTAEMFHYTSDEMLNQTTRILYPSDEAYEKLGLEAYPVLAEGRVFETEQKLIRKDGSPILVRYIGTAIDPSDMAKGVLWLLEDMTESKRAEEALRESEEKLALALRAANMGVWRFDLKEQKRYFDDQVCRCLGIDPASFRGTADEFFTALHPDDRDGIKAALKQTVEEGSPYEVEYRVVWADGGIHHIAARGRLAQDGDGVPQRVDGLLWDITRRKEAEERLRASLHEKEVLLKEVHHRVKNNLQVISSLVGLQADGSKDETVRGVLRDVIFRVRSMALVHEKLYHSVTLSSVDFAEYAQSLLNHLWRAHGLTAAAIRLSFDLEPVSLPVDIAVPCGLILNELAGNALKHAFQGRDEGEVAVSLHRKAEGEVSLCVRDDGVGIPPELDWRQAKSLGLRLVQMLAGQLRAEVEAVRSNGTEFIITFPTPHISSDGAREHE